MWEHDLSSEGLSDVWAAGRRERETKLFTLGLVDFSIRRLSTLHLELIVEQWPFSARVQWGVAGSLDCGQISLNTLAPVTLYWRMNLCERLHEESAMLVWFTALSRIAVFLYIFIRLNGSSVVPSVLFPVKANLISIQPQKKKQNNRFDLIQFVTTGDCIESLSIALAFFLFNTCCILAVFNLLVIKVRRFVSLRNGVHFV